MKPFLKFPIVRMALLCLALMEVGCISNGPRGNVALDDGWRFVRKDVANAQAIHVDDSHWQKVKLPHTWNNLDGQDGGANYDRGPAWYRRQLSIPGSYAGKSLFLRFDGASIVSKVYVNGQPAGEHRGAFGAFCFDVTNLLHSGNNVLAVRVDNSKQANVSPLSGDFTMCGGLYREVHLLVLNPLSISPLDDASPGVYLTQTSVTPDKATVDVRVVLRNEYSAVRNATVNCRIVDAKGKEVTENFANATIDPHGQADAVSRVTIDQPHLWAGTADPYLYHAVVEVRDGGKVVDRVVQPLGLRFYSVDADSGFRLNDRHYVLHGVCEHQDYFNKGWAITPKEIHQNYDLIREMGANAVRMAHYQHPDFEYSECDKRGVVVWAELALVNRLNDTPEFNDNVKQQLRELIKQNFNHPSICFWSLYNELHFKTKNPNEWRLVGELNDLAHQLDGTRLTTAASILPLAHPVNWIPDLNSFNRYPGWYHGSTDDWPTALDTVHEKYPEHPTAISEYGGGASVRQHDVYPTTSPVPRGFWHPEEWQAILHESAIRNMSERPYLWGTFLWNMFDFASDGRGEGDRAGINDKGLVTQDRKIRKDAFYIYKANWTVSPFVYITSRRFNPRPPGETTLKIYSNCDAVELFLNGKSLGRKSAADHVFVWDKIDLAGNKAKVSAVGEKDGKKYKDNCTWMVSKSAEPTVEHVNRQGQDSFNIE